VASASVPAAGILSAGGLRKAKPGCTPIEAKPEILGGHEDTVSIGLLYTLGKVRLLDLADLEWTYEVELMCPDNPIGTLDVYISDVHAQATAGNALALDIIRNSPGLEDMWQLHSSMAAKDLNAPDDFIANLEAMCEGRWIKLPARSDGTFTVTNGRNGFGRTYQSKRSLSVRPHVVQEDELQPDGEAIVLGGQRRKRVGGADSGDRGQVQRLRTRGHGDLHIGDLPITTHGKPDRYLSAAFPAPRTFGDHGLPVAFHSRQDLG
jgi:hypothetical protein